MKYNIEDQMSDDITILEQKKQVLLELKKVTRVFEAGENKVTALAEVDLTILKGEFIVILGPSGSGKTTLLNQIGGIDRPTTGTIFLDSQDLTSFSDKELTEHRANTIGWIFQFFNLIPSLTALENVGLGLELAKDYDSMDQRAFDLLKKVGMEDKVDRFPAQLSGGEQQRVAIARALVKKPQIVVADEPTGNLDTETGKGIINIMKELNDSEGITFVVVSHDETITKLADQVLKIVDGKINQVITKNK
ncbi:MAG: ABC transporter ATP-binding protein [Candidatus Kariarchaeaceae archaeon]